MTLLDKLFKPVLKKIIVNRWNYTESEYNKAAEMGLFDIFDLNKLRYRIKAEPVCSSHCSGCHNEGCVLYFNALGLLIRHKCPPYICIHGLSQISPIIYIYYDYLLQGKSPEEITFKHISCTDIGLDMGGLGNNLFKISIEKMPLLEFLRFMLTMSKYIFLRNNKAKGKCEILKEVKNSEPLIEPTDFMKTLPLSAEELNRFLNFQTRVKRLKSIEKFKDYKIVVKVVSSKGCIAGHSEGDEFYIDSMGKVNCSNNGICIMALHKIWWRIILIFERMTYVETDINNFQGKIFDLPINCYGGRYPISECGEILMTVQLEKQ